MATLYEMQNGLQILLLHVQILVQYNCKVQSAYNKVYRFFTGTK